MKILITGAAGFIGSHLFDYLSKEYEVLGIDNYSIGTYEHPGIKNIDLYKEPNKVSSLVDEFKPDVLFHLAAWAHEGLSQFCPLRITENNYSAYLNVLVPCIKNKVKRVICCSSMSVYGDQKPPFDEDIPLKPEDIYAVSKVAMEEATKILSRVYGFEHVILRPHNVYGPRQSLSDPYRNVVAIFINCLLREKPFYIYGDGEQRRAFSYVDDITPYMAKCVSRDNVVGQAINIGPLEDYSINDLAKAVLKAFKSDIKPIYLNDRPLEVKFAYSTNDKAINLLGYKTSVNFEEGIKRMIEWAKKEGPKEPKYLDDLELESNDTPQTWKEKLI